MEVSSTVTSGPFKVIENVEDDDIGNDKPAAVELPQSKPVIHEVDATKENILPKKTEEAIQKCSRQWLRIGGIILTSNDRDPIMNGQRLNDLVINFAQKVLEMQFPSVKGFQSTLSTGEKEKRHL